MDRAGRLVVLAGLPGSGKTTVAAWLSETHGFVVASRDVIRSAMFPRCTYSLDEKAAAFGAMKSAIQVMLALGFEVVTDGIAFSSGRELSEVVEIGRSAGVPVTIVHCRVPITVAQERVEADLANNADAPADRDAALVQATAARFDPLPDSTRVLDTTAPRDVVFERLATILGLKA